eukprot:TRINITY_DN4565_c0_g1_i3.p1 TRINITY_DN4565_c0_g1~~TRINITY_DN4565_c0_g1_i3.p1  ORF type:complete len:397 (+),score=78.88 TRINITY_DN4565_c0_g1_i3:173-1363(+)
MAPKIANLVIHGQLRIIFKPLVDAIPCFAALMISMTKPPVVKFKLDFGALGGSVTAAPVMAFLDPFIRDTLVNLLVWPNRMVVPILDEKYPGQFDDLYLHSVGLLRVDVIKADGLKKMDTFGKADPVVELFTRPERKQSSKIKRKTLEPEWNETFYFLVQEPMTQLLRLTMYDIDFFDPTRVLKGINFIKNLKDTVQSKEFMGRQAISLKEYTQQAGIRHEDWFNLGKGEWSNDMGVGKGEGRIKLALTYFPLSGLANKLRSADTGMLVVVVKKAYNLPPVDGGISVDPYIKVKIDKQSYFTTIKYKEINPEWNESFEFHHVQVGWDLKFKVYDKNLMIGTDDYLGVVSVPVSDIVESKYTDEMKREFHGVLQRDYEIEEADSGYLSVKVTFAPYF